MKQFLMRKPKKEDAAAIYEMLQPYKPYVGTSPLYTYLLICEHFNESSIVVENDDGEIIGFVSAYIPPNKPHTLFIWEVAVREGYHGNNLYIRMVQNICDRVCPQYIEATVNPSNSSGIKRLEEIANIFDTKLTTSPLFPSECFGKLDHEDEVLHSIGPLKNFSSETEKCA